MMVSLSQVGWLVRRVLLPSLLITVLLANLTLLIPDANSTITPPISDGRECTAASGKSCKAPPEPAGGEVVAAAAITNTTKTFAQLNDIKVPLAEHSPVKSTEKPTFTSPPPPHPLTTAKWNDTDDFYQTKRRIAERVERLKERCADFAQPSPVKVKSLDVLLTFRSQVLEEPRLLVCQVHKAGSMAWNVLLAHFYNIKNVLELNKDYYKMLEYLKPTVKRFKEVAASSDFERFLVARNPLERLLSAYRDRIWDQNIATWQAHRYVPLILKRSRGTSYSHQEIFFVNGSARIVPTFTEFVSFLVEQPVQEYDSHWMPISLFCEVCYVKYTAIVHMETYLSDIKYILAVTGMDQKVDVSLLLKNSHKGRGSTRDLLASHYSALGPKLLQMIVSVYKHDFLFFDYDPTEFLRKVSPNVTIRWRH